MSEIIKVGMADLKTCVSPDGVTTLGLGSCVGIAIRDPVTKIGGLAHIMLPDSTTIRNSSQNIAKFADTGIDELVRQMEKLGAKKARMVAKIAGGATMFTFQGKNDMMQVGDRNVEAVKKKLKEISIPILAQDTGKNYGRTVTFYPETGEFHIRAVGKSESIIKGWMTGWVNYEQKEYAIAFDADRRCVYLDRNAGEKLFVTGKSCGTFYCYAAVLLSGKCDPAVAGPVRQTE